MNRVSNILAIIPARGGSKEIPKKNIKLFNDKPLIYYAIQLAIKAEKRGVIAGHIVSTDNKEIASIAEEYEGNVPFMRPKKLATDKSLVIYTIIHAVNWWEKNNKEKIHSVMILQPTNPLTRIKDIESSVKHYLNNQPKAKCLISICDAQNVRLPKLYYKKGRYIEQVINGLNPSERRQGLRKIYWRNGGIYITRRDLLFEQKKIIDNNPLSYEMSRYHSIDLDDMYDWKIAEFLIKNSKQE